MTISLGWIVPIFLLVMAISLFCRASQEPGGRFAGLLHVLLACALVMIAFAFTVGYLVAF